MHSGPHRRPRQRVMLATVHSEAGAEVAQKKRCKKRGLVARHGRRAHARQHVGRCSELQAERRGPAVTVSRRACAPTLCAPLAGVERGQLRVALGKATCSACWSMLEQGHRRGGLVAHSTIASSLHGSARARTSLY